MKRVLMSADSVGGVLSYAEDLCRGLSASGVEVLLAVMGGKLDPRQRAAFDAIEGVRIEDSDYALEWMEDPWDEVSEAGVWLLELADRFAPDVVHLNGYAHAALPWTRPVLVVGHSCVASWFEAVKREPLPDRFAPYDRYARLGLRAASVVVAPSAYMADALERHYGAIGDLRVIENGVWLEDHRVAPKEPFVLAAGRVWDEAKNVRMLAELASSLPWPVKIAGEARGAALPAGVEALGRLGRSELREVMSRASIFVHVPRYEPFGLAPLEAAASGCALVVSDIPSLRAIWSGAAMSVPTDDAEALRAAIVAITRDAERCGTLGAKARERSRRYSAREMTARYLALYDELSGALEHRRAS